MASAQEKLHIMITALQGAAQLDSIASELSDVTIAVQNAAHMVFEAQPLNILQKTWVAACM